MSCERYEKQISLYVENELEGDEKKAMEQHLQDCQSCRQQLEAIKYMQGMFKQEEEDIKLNKIRVKIYAKVLRDLLIMFVGLVIIVSVVSVSGGLAQMFLLDQLTMGIRFFFGLGILLLILGLIILVYDLFVDIVKVIMRK